MGKVPRRIKGSSESNDSKYSIMRNDAADISLLHIVQSFMLNILHKSGKDPKPTLPAFLSQRIRPYQRPSNYEILSRDQVSISELTVDDVIIVVMGPTGAGKSHFIHTLAEDESVVGHGLESYTGGVSAYRVRCSDGVDVVLVDTPGFNDTHLSDQSVLEVTAKWLKKVGKRGLQVSAFLYLHRITDNRMGSAPQKSLKVFQEIAGEHFFSRVTLMTTMWPESVDTIENEEIQIIEAEMREAEMREAALREVYWATMIQQGSRVARFTNTRESARRIVDSIIIAESETQWSRIQQELVDQGKTPPTTEARRELHAVYENMVARQNGLMQQLRAEMERATADPIAITELRQQLRDELVRWKNVGKEMRQSDSSGKGGWRRLFCLP